MTFLATLFVGVAQGLAVGVAVSLLVFIARTARPHVVEVGRVKGTARYRNVERWATRTDDRIALLRMDGPLYFANARFFEDRAQGLVSDRPLIEHLIVVASAIGDIDASGTELLIDLDEELRDGGVQLHLVTVRGPVRDTLANTALWDQIATVAVQPGAPQAAGLVDGVPFLGLPGNPVAAMVSFAVFVRPLVQTLRGLAVESGGSLVELAAPVEPHREKTRFVPARWAELDDRRVAVPDGRQGSHLVAGMADTDLLLEITPGDEALPAGKLVPALFLVAASDTPRKVRTTLAYRAATP